MKDVILSKIEKNIKRPGISKLVFWLENDTDYFTAPASTRFHLAEEEGLSIHSDNVYGQYYHMIEGYSWSNLPNAENIAIEGFFHDLCKVNVYKKNDEEATAAQVNYLKRLCSQHKKGEVLLLLNSGKVNKTYCSCLIDWLKNRSTEPQPEQITFYNYEDGYLPVGHGEKSIIYLQRFIELEPREIMAIRWHMGPWEELSVNEWKAMNEAQSLISDVQLLHIADLQAGFFEIWGR